MGGVYSLVMDYWAPEYFVAVLGLDGAGKTALVQRITYGNVVETVPTCGFNISKVKVHNCSIQLADVCGQDSIRSLWGVMYHAADGVIYVVDGTDLSRVPLAMSELKKVMAYPSLEGKPFLILINKHDENAMECSVLKEQIVGLNWRAFDVSVKDGTGVNEALTWFAANLE